MIGPGALPRFSAALVLAAALAGAVTAAAGEGPRVGERFPSRALPGLEGSRVAVPDDFAGKVLVLYFWTEGCAGCREEMPALAALSRRYESRGLAVLAVNVGQPEAKVRTFVERLPSAPPVLLDGEGKAARDYGVPNVPRTYLLDREGILRYRILGEASRETLNKLLLPML